jgi:uncharacterized protein (DUF1697 family)
MRQYIAFLRGINGGLTLKMADLRKLFESLGFTNIKTVLATGNVIFDAAQGTRMEIANQIERAIASTYSYETVAILYTKDELGDLIEADPFHSIAPSTQSSLQVSFTQGNSGRLPFDTPYDVPQKGYKVLGMIDGVVCSVIDLSGATRPDLLAVLDRTFNKKVTTRNWKTVERCYQAMLAGADE